VAHEDHFRGRPRNDGLHYVYFPSTSAAAAAFEADDIDVMFAPPDIQHRFENVSGSTLHEHVYYTPISLAFNHRHPLLQDITVRRAIAMGIDKTAIVEAATGGRGAVAHNQFSASGPLDQYNDYTNATTLEYDPDAANQMLDNAGHTRGTDGVRVSPGGERFSFSLLTYTGFEEYRTGQALLQEMLLEIGIEIVPQLADFSTLEGMRSNPNPQPDIRSLELQEWPHALEFDPDLFSELHSDSFPPGSNYMWFVDPEVNTLIERGRTTTDQDERTAIYRELDVRRAETLPNVPLYSAIDAWVVSDRVAGVSESPYFRRYVMTNAQDWSTR
jgi:peptide/nickel transport system substrate-binding protein